MLSEFLCVCVCDTVHVFTQQEIGLFWGGFPTGESSYCIIQLLEPETAIPQGCILDEFDCPLLTMVDFFYVIPVYTASGGGAIKKVIRRTGGRGGGGGGAGGVLSVLDPIRKAGGGGGGGVCCPFWA